MHLRVLSAAALVASLALTVPAWADYWDHNGSRMYVEQIDNELSITYLEPRSGIAATGVTTDTQLFHGNVDNDGYVHGVAFLFKKGCQPAPYAVDGEFSHHRHKLTLRGYAPIRARNSCEILGYDVNKNSDLVFTFLEPDDE